MSVYMIAYRGNDELNTTAFLADEDGNEEAIAVFTSRSRASHFASEFDWGGEQPFREFTAIDLPTGGRRSTSGRPISQKRPRAPQAWLVNRFNQGDDSQPSDPRKSPRESSFSCNSATNPTQN